MSDIAIQVQNLSKVYRVTVGGPQATTVQEALVGLAKSPFRYLREMTRPATEAETLWALRDVSFDVRRGEVLGIIGQNGAGKSTLLKLLSRITDPTSGRAVIRGRVGSLLEVGTGFNPELTGRENIYVNGAILGMKKREIEAKFDEIVQFSEVERFLDTPVKRYSSGMRVRLAFAVAAHLEPEIMIMDEVLSVGDVSFRKKSQDRLRSAALDGRTVLFVSHSMEAVASLCPRTIWLDGGRLMADGRSSDVIEAYVAAKGDQQAELSGASGFQVRSLVLRNGLGEATHHFYPGDDLVIEMNYFAPQRIPSPFIWFCVDSKRGPCFGANMLLDGNNPAELSGAGRLVCRFKSIPLIPQAYHLRMAIRDSNGQNAILEPQQVADFSVIGDLADYGLPGEMAQSLAPTSVPVVVPYEWELPDGQVRPVAITQTSVDQPPLAIAAR